MRHRLAAAAVTVLAASAGDGSCGDAGTPKACQIDTRGIRVEHRLVADLVTARCDPKPLKHIFEVWLEYRGSSGEPWIDGGPHQFGRTIPDAAGYTLRAEGHTCVAGQWRTHWHAYGYSSANIRFDVTDHDMFATPISAKDCQ